MNKGCFSKIIVAICILFIMAYTIGSMYMFFRMGSEMTVLTPLVYAFFGTELCMLLVKTLLSKKMENKQENKEQPKIPTNPVIDDEINED